MAAGNRDNLARTATGKIRRADLRATAGQPGAVIAPAAETEEAHRHCR